MARKAFDDLLAAGRGQQESSTRILLGLTEPEVATQDASEAEEAPVEQLRSTLHTEDASESTPAAPMAADTPEEPVVAPTDAQPPRPKPAGRSNRNALTGNAGREPAAAGALGGGVLELLPAVDDVLVTGVRGGGRDVRDVTYEIPAAAYFAFMRLKNDLARTAHRKVTVAALIEAALRLLPDDLDILDAEMRRLEPGEELRRLTARISEDRYRQIQGVLLDLYERSGTRRSGTELWTYLVTKLLAAN